MAYVQLTPAIELLECPSCGAASASRMPTTDALAEYYGSYYANDDEPHVTLHGLDGWAQHIALAVRPAPTTGALLDFGGGDASLGCAVARLLGPGTHVTLVDHADPGNPQIAYCREIGQVEGSFDVVLASAVLEHIPDLATELPALLARVRPGGAFYARTPYIAPFMRFFRVDFGYPGHVHDLGPGFWNRLPERAPGFDLVVSRPSRVETSFSRSLGRTLAAHVLKMPARLELAVRGRPRRLAWPFVGGWEVVLRRRGC